MLTIHYMFNNVMFKTKQELYKNFLDVNIRVSPQNLEKCH